MHLSNEEFLNELGKLFVARQETGSVFLSTKRLTYSAPEEDVEMNSAEASGSSTPASTTPARPWPCLYRATDGKGKKDSKVKLSTIVQPSDAVTFSSAYGAVLKSHMTSLRPKKKKRKNPATSSTKSGSKTSSSQPNSSSNPTRKAGAGYSPRLSKVVGPRRGAGHEKRRRSERRRQRDLFKLWARRKLEKGLKSK